jgi:hypothetical protein
MASVAAVISPAWHDHLDAEVLGMDETDGCAVACLTLIRRADDLLALLLDCSDYQRESVRFAVGKQCATYYFG